MLRGLRIAAFTGFLIGVRGAIAVLLIRLGLAGWHPPRHPCRPVQQSKVDRASMVVDYPRGSDPALASLAEQYVGLSFEA
jgi:hypothetical protein